MFVYNPYDVSWCPVTEFLMSFFCSFWAKKREEHMTYRDRIDIISQILDAANGGATRSKIVYNAFLNYEQLKEFVTLLTQVGLLSLDSQMHTFKTTEKGLKFLQIYTQMRDMVNTGLSAKSLQQQPQQISIQRSEGGGEEVS